MHSADLPSGPMDPTLDPLWKTELDAWAAKLRGTRDNTVDMTSLPKRASEALDKIYALKRGKELLYERKTVTPYTKATHALYQLADGGLEERWIPVVREALKVLDQVITDTNALSSATNETPMYKEMIDRTTGIAQELRKFLGKDAPQPQAPAEVGGGRRSSRRRSSRRRSSRRRSSKRRLGSRRSSRRR